MGSRSVRDGGQTLAGVHADVIVPKPAKRIMVLARIGIRAVRGVDAAAIVRMRHTPVVHARPARIRIDKDGHLRVHGRGAFGPALGRVVRVRHRACIATQPAIKARVSTAKGVRDKRRVLDGRHGGRRVQRIRQPGTVGRGRQSDRGLEEIVRL